MTYQQTIDFLFSSLPVFQKEGATAYKPGLDSTINLLEKLDNPHEKFKTIHVAGTNGKGSCSHILASVYQTLGYKTGLYTSPHLYDFRERIKINGQMIEEQEVVDFVTANRDNIKGLSFFEMTVGLAFDYFATKQVDIAIIETGLGGRLDSTNVISPLASIITNIALDHTALLGNTLQQIASEKAGIIKPGTPIIIGDRNNETEVVFIKRANELNAPIYFAQDDNLSAPCELKGIYQQQNIATVLKTLQVLGLTDYQAIEQGLANVVTNTGLHGRWEQLATKPLTICDTGHNTHGLTQVVKQIGEQKYDKLYFVLGVVNDKDLDTILPLLPKQAHYIFTAANISRALPADELMNKASTHKLEGEKIDGVKNALARAQELASEDDMIFVGGSTFTVGDLFSC